MVNMWIRVMSNFDCYLEAYYSKYRLLKAKYWFLGVVQIINNFILVIVFSTGLYTNRVQLCIVEIMYVA